MIDSRKSFTGALLEEAKKDFLDYQGTGMSITEMSHRSKPFMAVNAEANALLRELMHIPDDYAVLFVQGGASQQFAASTQCMVAPLTLRPSAGSPPRLSGS